MTARGRSALALLLSLTVAISAGWITYINLVEAYGQGPPYYGRTTNMDKWEDPLVFLLTVNAAAVAIIIAAWRAGRRRA